MKMFKVGDRVKISEDLKVNEYYNGVLFIEDMKKYLGKEVTIVSKDEDGDFTVDVDDGRYFWANQMLEEIEEELPPMENGVEVVFNPVETKIEDPNAGTWKLKDQDKQDIMDSLEQRLNSIDNRIARLCDESDRIVRLMQKLSRI